MCIFWSTPGKKFGTVSFSQVLRHSGWVSSIRAHVAALQIIMPSPRLVSSRWATSKVAGVESIAVSAASPWGVQSASLPFTVFHSPSDRASFHCSENGGLSTSRSKRVRAASSSGASFVKSPTITFRWT